jgi:DNA-binding NarL/FixJ family response regulator
VRTLQERDVAALLALTAELSALDDVDPFPPQLLGRIATLIFNREAGYSELDRSEERTIRQSWWADGDGGTDTGGDDDGHRYWRLRHSHPVCSYRERTNDWTTVRKISDFATQRELRRTAIWDEVYRSEGFNYWIDVGLRPTGAQTRVFVFARGRDDFDERDRLVLELLQPHLQRRYDRVQAAVEATDALASIQESVADDDPQHVVLCTAHGVIEFASQESRRLLERYLQCGNGHLPPEVLRAIKSRSQPIAVECEGQRLTIRAARCVGLHVLLLGEEDLRLDRLTPRQRTILTHVAEGETDGEIAASIGIASSTVNKHLENIYERLGVHTRTAAAALVSTRSTNGSPAS